MMNEKRPDYGSVITHDFRRAVRGQAAGEEDLRGGGGGGTSGGMEGRIARLESDMGHVKDTLKSLDTRAAGVQKDMGDVRVAIAALQSDVRHLPSKSYIIKALTGGLGLITALTLFGDRLRHLLGL